MDSNRDESERCVRLAEKFLQYGETDQAVKYLNKAERLFPSQRAKDLLEGIEFAESSFSCFENNESNERIQSVSPEAPSTEGKPDVFTVQQDPIYTDEQLTAVRKIRKCKDYYEILGVEKHCSEDDLKRSYKKLALKFHPDKNRAPGAAEAFKAIGNAFGVLSNPTKRRKYDRYDADEDVRTAPRRQPSYTSDNYMYDFTHGFEGDISADELFRMFFGTAFESAKKTFEPVRPPRTAATRRQTSAPRPPPSPPVYRPPPLQKCRQSSGFLLQLSPIIFLVILSMFSVLLVSDSAYSLHQDSKYSDERSTRRFGVIYFVRSDFDDKYPADGDDFRRVEMQVEDEHVSNLQYRCYREKTHRENLMWRARIYHNDALFKQAKDLRSPSCEALQDLRVLTSAEQLLTS